MPRKCKFRNCATTNTSRLRMFRFPKEPESFMERFTNDDSNTEREKYPWRTLDSLPPEIILHIFAYLPAKYAINVLSKVCKYFKEIIENDITWKMRIFHRWPKTYPIIESIFSELDWKVACIEREEQYHLWSNYKENMHKFHFEDAHFGCVNVVKLIEDGTLCMSGGRDGYIKLWNVGKLVFMAPTLPDHFCITSGFHANAWVWDVAYDKHLNHLYSSGFDCNIKCWNVEEPLRLLATYSLSSPVLCLAHYGNLLASGSFGRNVNIFDHRTHGTTPILSHNQHRKSVLCIDLDEKYVISGSEDKSVVVYDLIASKVLKRLELENFPLSMSYGKGQLFFGDVNNFIHAIDPTHGAFNLMQTISSGHSNKVTGVQHSFGSIITCSTDKTIRILEPNIDPATIAVLDATNEVAGISFDKNILVNANVDDSITFWFPEND